MDWINNMKINMRLNIIIGAIITVALVALGWYNYSAQKNKLISSTDERMSERLIDMAEIIKVEIQNANEKLTIAGNLVHNQFVDSDLNIDFKNTYTDTVINQETRKKDIIELNEWSLEGKNIARDYSFVDRIQQQTSATATIFQKTDVGYVRISTNVMTLDQERAVGTYIPYNSPVVKTIENGEVFRGRAFVVNDWYLTYYEPIYKNDSLVGMLYVGVREKDLEKIKSLFNAKKFYRTGYVYVIDQQGELIIHPDMEGENVKNSTPYKQIISDDDGIGMSRYKWPENQEGKWKQQYFRFIDLIDAYIVITYFEEELFSDLKRIRSSVFITVIIVLGIVILVLTLLTNSIKTSLNKGVRFAQSIANGDLATSIDVHQKDEVGELAKSLNDMAARLREVVEGVTSGSSTLLSASEQLSSTAQGMSQSTNQQASTVEEVSSSMEEMASGIEQNTENAKQTEKISKQALISVQTGYDSTKQAVEAMRQIAQKTSIIGDIAFQTNLLALNAAVEAARAGEHGKGFAVVAAEVRKLAERSRVAAEEIDAVSSKSINIADNAGIQLEKIVPEIERTATLVQEIAAASSEQSSGAEQVNNAIQQLNDVTQSNAASSEELATSAEELSGQSEQLKNLISFFKVNTKDQ
jgi:methyl-accepting chemotaxis protein